MESILNKKRDEAPAVDPKDAKKQPKEAPKAAKKGGKEDLGSYESPLTATPSGIESVTFLLDTELYNLPFECLSCMKGVPAVSRDTTLLVLGRKLRHLKYKPELNNSEGFGLDKLKYVCYDFKAKEENGEDTFLKVSKNNQTLKFEGISTSKRVPSLG